ncbi:MAG: four helix bundle protein [Bacteroidetes bacterium]|nr:four helix bundle protein [Bacteroidota bacterium]
MGEFKKLNVWRKSKDLAVAIYSLTSKGSISKDFGLIDQMRRAAVSIPSNIAEGDQLGSNQQSIRHFYIARGSASELLTQTLIAEEIKYITKNELKTIEKECDDICSMLTRLINIRTSRIAKQPKIHPKS